MHVKLVVAPWTRYWERARSCTHASVLPLLNYNCSEAARILRFKDCSICCISRDIMDPPAVTGSGFNERYSVMTYNDNNFSEPTRLPFNRSAESEPSTVSETASLIIAISITAIYSAICALGLLGNVLVMYGVVRYPSSLLLHCKHINKQDHDHHKKHNLFILKYNITKTGSWIDSILYMFRVALFNCINNVFQMFTYCVRTMCEKLEIKLLL